MTDKTNAYFQAMQQTYTEFKQARKIRWAEKTKSPFTSDQLVAYRSWFDSILNQSNIFEVHDFPWEDNVHDFVETLRAAGITEFAVTTNSTTLIQLLHGLATEGCTMQGLCTVTRSEFRWGGDGTEEYQGILFHT